MCLKCRRVLICPFPGLPITFLFLHFLQKYIVESSLCLAVETKLLIGLENLNEVRDRHYLEQMQNVTNGR